MNTNPTVIVTGASRGLGAATAVSLANMGTIVVLTARSVDALQTVANQIGDRAIVVPGDVMDPAACQRVVAKAVARTGRLDGLVNNAGVLDPIAALADADPDALHLNLQVNVLGPMLMTQAALPHLRERNGRVIHISSGAAVKAIPGWSAYCTSKAALNHFNRVLAAEEPAITTLAVRPGVVDTAMQTQIRQEGASGMPSAAHQRFVNLHADDQLLPPEKPARAIATLACHAPHAWSGDFIEWNDERVAALAG